MFLCWLVLQIVCYGDSLVWVHIPKHIAMLFLNESLRNKYATSRQTKYTVTGLQYPKFWLCLYPHPSTIHALAFFRLSSKTSQGFCAILRPTFIDSKPVVANCQIFDVGMPILVSRTELSRSVNTLPCQRFVPIVYQAPLLVQYFQSAKSTPNAHTTFLEGPVTMQ